MPAVPRSIASSASRYILLAGGAGGASIMFAGKVHSMTAPAPADGSRSINRIDRTEARHLVSGPFGIQTIPALLGALVCIGAIYTKSRILLPETGAPIARDLATAAQSLGVVIAKGEGTYTKALYATLGGTVLGSMAADGIVFGGDPNPY